MNSLNAISIVLMIVSPHPVSAAGGRYARGRRREHAHEGHMGWALHAATCITSSNSHLLSVWIALIIPGDRLAVRSFTPSPRFR